MRQRMGPAGVAVGVGPARDVQAVRQNKHRLSTTIDLNERYTTQFPSKGLFRFFLGYNKRGPSIAALPLHGYIFHLGRHIHSASGDCYLTIFPFLLPHASVILQRMPPSKIKHTVIFILFFFSGLLLAAAPMQSSTPPPPTPTPVSPCPPDWQETCSWAAAVGPTYGPGAIVLIALLVIGVWALRRFGAVGNKKVEQYIQETVEEGETSVAFSEATRAYLERFEKYYSRFNFRGLEDVSGAKVPPFNKAYISLRLASSTAPRVLDKPDDSEETTRLLRDEAAREVSLAEAIQQTPRLAIVGTAGSGKSTLLQWAGVAAARARLHTAEPLTDEQRAFVAALGARPPMPVFIALRDFVKHCHPAGQPARSITPAALVEFMSHFYAEQFSSMTFPADFFIQHLKRGCLLLLDGVDEVSPKDRTAVRSAVEGLVIDYGVERNRYVLASRSVAYQGEAEFSDFRQVQVQPLSAEQRAVLLRYWCDAIYLPEEAQRNAADLNSGINRSDQQVRDLACTPLMIAIFILVYFHNQRRLPNQRAEFYYRAARVLVSETHKPGAPDYPEWERLSLETRIDHLKRIAYELYVRDRNTVTADELEEWTADEFNGDDEAARSFFTAAANRSGLLEEKGGEYGFFTHKTFHEFLTGLYLAQNLEDDPEINPKVNWTSVLTAHLTNDQWLEVTRLAAGALAYLNAAKANKFVKLLSGLGETDIERATALERAALSQADFPLDRAQANRADLVQRLEPQMVNLQLQAPFRRRLGLALGALGDPRFSPTPLSPEGRGVGGEGIKPINVILPALITIPAGEFRMGTSEAEAKQLEAQHAKAWGDEKPQHTVSVSEFAIGKYSITNAEFRAFVDPPVLGYENKDYWSAEGWRWRAGQLEADLSVYSKKRQKSVRERMARRPVEKRGQPFFWDDPQWNVSNLPVVGVTWYEAEAYCNWLRVVTGQKFRLPTEAEWEKAARGPQGSLWPWGNEWDAERCSSEESKLNATMPVGIYPHGAAVWPDGPVEDLVGNVWEWCADWWQSDLYEQRQDQVSTDPSGPTSGSARLLRGGSYVSLLRHCRAAYRGRPGPAYFGNDLGFRVVCSP
jgi:formylglycine-generating enzyme required for sulfatase activity